MGNKIPLLLMLFNGVTIIIIVMARTVNAAISLLQLQYFLYILRRSFSSSSSYSILRNLFILVNATYTIIKLMFSIAIHNQIVTKFRPLSFQGNHDMCFTSNISYNNSRIIIMNLPLLQHG